MNTRHKVLAGATAAVVAVLTASGAAVALRADGDELAGPERSRVSEAAITQIGPGTVTDVEQDDGAYEVELVRPDGSTVDALLSSELEVLRSETDDDRADDWPLGDAIDPEATDRARAAALKEAPDGTVTEIDREAWGYEVQVIRPSGAATEVHLDAAFEVISVTQDFDD